MDYKDLTVPLKVQNKIQETADTYSFVLDIPQDLKAKFAYKAGQFVSFFIDINGEQVRRSYSIASCPDVEPELKVSVKRVPGGIMSNYLIDEVHQGDQLETTPPAGLFCLPKDTNANEYVFFAAGSGITPIISLIKSVLHKNSENKCRLLYANRNEDSIIFYRELKALNEAHHQRFQYEYVLSQPKKDFAGLTGRLHGPDVQDFLKVGHCSQNAYYFLCGPEGFMSTIESALEIYGVERPHIIKESFFTPPVKVAQPANSQKATAGDDSFLRSLDGAVLIGDKDVAAKPKKIFVELDGENIEVPAKEGQSVLETLLEAGYSPPYSCMDGACMACMGKVTKGLVYQEDMGILTEDNTEVGECLTCQAKPGSDEVSISYEI